MNDAWHGSHAPSRFWRGGPWALELRDDELADLTYDGRPVLRSIRAVVRDRDWNTAAWVIDRVHETESTLEILARTEGFGAEFRGTVRVDAADDLLVVSFDAVSDTAFETNRTGLVVLHPPHLAGSPLAVAHSDGSTEHGSYPVDISPHQPALDIAGLSWQDDGLDIDLSFTGDTFEMEDQRNWTDASYKTYSRPLALPFPYPLAAGEHVRQSIAVRVTATAPPAEGADPDRIVLTETGIPFPAIAVGASTGADPNPFTRRWPRVSWSNSISPPPAGTPRSPGPPHPVVRSMSGSCWTPRTPEALDELVGRLAGLPVLRLAAFDRVTHVTDAEAGAAVRAALAEAGLDLPVIGGARSHFTELNRERGRIPDDLDGIVFSVTPLFHSATTEQLVESIGMQRLVAEQAVRLAGSAPVHIGPVTLRPRFNNVATVPPPVPEDIDLARGYGAHLSQPDDARQDAVELAAWTIASAAALAVPGVASIAYFEEWGPRGVLDDAGAERPVADAVRGLVALSGLPLLSGDSPDGLVWAVGGDSPDGRIILVANLGAAPREVTVVVGGVEQTMTVPEEGWRAAGAEATGSGAQQGTQRSHRD